MSKNTSKPIKKRVIIWAIIVSPIFFLAILFLGVSNGSFGFMPSFNQLENPKSTLATEVYSEDTVLLGTYYYKVNRSKSEFSELSPYLIDALVATEDERFYKHSGVDFRGLMRVLVRTVLMGDRNAGGGSTISQQLAKMLFPRENFSSSIKMVFRKFREWIIAINLERNYTKEEIIAMYFNQFDFLYNAVGVKSASKVYFNCNPNELNIEQAATLVGMAKNPSFFNPLRRPEKTLSRRNVVLYQMLKNDKISQANYDSLKMIPLKIDYQKVDHKLGSATYFREFLRTSLNANLPKKENYYNVTKFQEDSTEWADNPMFGWCHKNVKPDGSNYNLYEDGLRIYTTVNSKIQRYAEEAVEEHLKLKLQVAFDKEKKNQRSAPFSRNLSSKQIEKIMTVAMKRTERYRLLRKANAPMDSIKKVFNTPVQMFVFSWNGEIDTTMTPMDSLRYYKHFLQSGLMSIDPHTGHVKAYVGGIDYSHFQYDHVTRAKRQIGSTFKPFLYTLAMQNGFSPCDQVPNVPVTILLDDGKTWTPSGGGQEKWDRKILSLEFGLAHSLNNISAWLMNQFKPKAVIDIARNMGIKSTIPEVPSICLGVADLKLSEMVGAYATFANKGVYNEPVYISRIEDNKGNILASFSSTKKEAISENTAAIMLKLLQGVVNRGTAIRLNLDNYPYKIKAQIGAKTGTSQNHSDGWFMGIAPNLVSGVWTGGDNRAIHFNGIRLGQGATMALPIWAIFMNKVYKDSTLGITRDDIFELPENFDVDFNCIDISDTGKDGRFEEDNDELGI